jgi:hypothetical protein
MFKPLTNGRVNDWTPVLMDAAAGEAAPLSLSKSLRVVRTYSSSRSDGMNLGRRFNAG